MNSLKDSNRRWLLEMIAELPDTTLGSWACVLLKLQIMSTLYRLGGLAGEW
ncbi:hypothetical protein [Trinickia mobilis]|uniref:hypothetical protein n=1 Tax=Trinickia mobilis TaxID=2816356 RepID=UPI001A8D2195|nr:hypothetical protein [Trinickia mobilis]